MAGIPVTGDLYFNIDGKMMEIKRQLRQNGGYPFDPQQLNVALQAIVEGRFGPLVPAAASAAFVSVVLPLWRVVRLGDHKTPKAYVTAIEAKRGMGIGTYAAQILPKIAIASKEEDIEIFLGSARDFGFTMSAVRSAIFERAALHGYYPCPAEVGPAARLGYTDQPKDQWFRLAMVPIANAYGDLEIFIVGHDNEGMMLGANRGQPGREWSPDDVWAWCRRKL